MVARRARLSSLLEWLAALACVIGIAALGSAVVGNLHTVSAVAPVIAHEEATPNPPSAIPPRSVSVPVLSLSNGVELRVGDTAAAMSSRIRPDAESAPAAIDRTQTGERVTRFYMQDGQRFAVVLEPLADDGQVRISAIYLLSSR